MFDQERWTDLVQLLQAAPQRSADMDYYYGVALAHLERWEDARKALLEGRILALRDKRFPIELAGVAFKLKRIHEAKLNLYRALALDPHEPYANDFLATLYFLEGNTEAALKYWNRVAKPEIVSVRNDPPLRVRPALLDHVLAFSPASTFTLEELRTSQARIQGMEVFPSHHFDLLARPDGKFDVLLRARELNGFGQGKLESLLRVFGGIIFEEITPEYFNLHGTTTNVTSLFRWDTDKRRIMAGISGPLGGNPQWRYRIFTDLRNENWTIQTSFTGPATILGALNLRRESVAAEITRLVGWRWRWRAGVEGSYRDFRNVLDQGAFSLPLLSQGYQLKQTAQIDYQLWRSAERRITVASGLTSQAGRIWSQPGQSFEKLQGLLETHWLPRPQGVDYETLWRVRAGRTFGQAPFDELFMLGVERDNDLSMRAHTGTRHGQKGSAPIGRNYLLSNWETDKNLYSNGIFTWQAGPFLDAGKITDHQTALGSRKWLFDTGVQTKLRVLGVHVVLLYGKDLRSGNNAFFATVVP